MFNWQNIIRELIYVKLLPRDIYEPARITVLFVVHYKPTLRDRKY